MDWIKSIEEYAPCNEQEKKDKELTLKYAGLFDDILTRKNELIHMTSSAFVVNKDKSKALMVHHNIYNSWSWTGGHADGESDLLFVAIKEAKEETGIGNVSPVSEDILSLDIIPVLGHIKRGKYVSPHLHISAAYLLEADESDYLAIKADENSDVKWVPIEDIEYCSDEPHMKKIYRKIISKVNGMYPRSKVNSTE
jgi:8-oxo-dGTP pyrophosphatase MutT (NUDIX family)